MDTAVRDCIQICNVTLEHLEAPTIRGDVARLFNAQPVSDLPSCHPMTSQAAHRGKTRKKRVETKRLRALKSPERCHVPLLQMSAGSSSASSALARSSWEAKRKASRMRRGETWITCSISMHLPPPLEHSPTLQNSNNTKQHNTHIPQSTRQSTKQSSKKHTTINDTKANKQKQQYRTAYRQHKGRQQTQADKAPPVQQHTSCN